MTNRLNQRKTKAAAILSPRAQHAPSVDLRRTNPMRRVSKREWRELWPEIITGALWAAAMIALAIAWHLAGDHSPFP